MNEKDWLLDWLLQRNPDVDVHAGQNLLYNGLIDSFGFIELIEAIEKNFGVVGAGI